MASYSQAPTRAAKREILRQARDLAARMRQDRQLEDLLEQAAAQQLVARHADARWVPAPWDAD